MQETSYFSQQNLRVLKRFLVVLILIQVGCNKPEVEIPEYAKYDWYAHYVVDENEQSMFKDGTDSNIEPHLYANQSYGFTVLPDNSENIIYISMESGITSTSSETNSQIWFSFQIITENQDLINMKGLSKEVRLSKLLSYLKGRQYLNTPTNRIIDDYVNIRLQDKMGNFYLNNLSTGGSLGVILNYEIKVTDATIVTHEDHGKVIQLTMDFIAEVQDSMRKIFYSVEARTQTYLIAPFE